MIARKWRWKVAQEVAPFNIRVLLVEPSGFRTDWARSARQAVNPIAAYDSTPPRQQVETARKLDAPQAGDPKKAAEAIINDVAQGGPNLHLPLGTGSFLTTMAKLERLRTEYASLEDIARSTDDNWP